MIRCLIVDDEPLARQSLRRLLAPDFEVLAEAANGLEALERVEELRPDVVFLDIEMPGLNGLDTAKQLPRSIRVVFVTAFDQYAVAAFEANAIDYLLKPLQAERLAAALERLRLRPDASYTATLERMLRELRPAAPSKVAARKGKRIVLLSPSEITHALIEDKLVFLSASGERYWTDRTIGELEDMLAPVGFFRIARGEVVNLEFVRELIPWFSGTWRLKLTTGEELDVSRERGRELKNRLGL